MKTDEKDDTIVDISGLTHDDLVDVYEKLTQKYCELREQNDCLNQKLHQEISQKKVFQNTINDLQSELDDLINYKNDKIIQQIEKKTEEYKNKNQSLIMEKIALETKIEELSATIEKVSNELKEVRGFLAVKAIKPRVSDTFAKSLELENENLRSTINDMKEQMEEIVVKYSESTSRIEELTERLECIQDNLETKKAELDEKTESLEHLQEKVHELSTELTLLRNSSELDENNRKGNSLFAEVDDQRQKMKKILQSERINYLEMKKAYNSKEMEIRRLKRENQNIKSEIQACSNQLKRGEQLSSNQNKIYISNLESDKHNLEIQLRKMEEKLIDLAKDQKMYWVETVLTTASKEARDLKDKHYVLLREKTTLADNHSKALKELAKVRLDSIKLKVLLGRIVDEFKIKIDVNQYFDLGIDEGIFENLKLGNYETYDFVDSMNENVNKKEDDSMNGMLNESTIILLGGREKLGIAVPNVQDDDTFGAKRQKLEEVDVNAGSNEQNNCVDLSIDTQKSKESIQLQNDEPSTSSKEFKADSEIQKLCQEKENTQTYSSSPAKTIVKSEVQSPLKTKSIHFSNKVETRVIDTTKEGFQQSQEARKRPAITVKRIIIPSKTSKP